MFMSSVRRVSNHREGYGFIHFENKEAADNAIARVNDKNILDRTVFVGHFKTKTERVAELGERANRFTNVYAKNLDKATTEADLQAQAMIQSKGVPLSDRVRATMVEAFPITEPTIAHICGRLKFSRSTLLRRLRDEGVTFQSLLDETRKDLAIRYLLKSDLNNQQIAHLAGYRDPNAFQRAFRRWTGMTPQDLRSGHMG